MSSGTFTPTNHLRAEADEGWVALVMGGYFHNSNERRDTPTRRLRAYFNLGDDYMLRKGATTDKDGHRTDLMRYDGRCSKMSEQQTNNHMLYRHLDGFQVRDLESFTWRARYQDRLSEIRAQRIDDNRWSVEYCSNHQNSQNRFEMVEYLHLLRNWFQMIDPETLEIIKAETIISLVSVAGSACQVVREGASRGNHPQMFNQLMEFAKSKGITDAHECFGARAVHGEPQRSELHEWWKMMLALPRDEDQPTFHEGLEVLHQWKLDHSGILYARHKRLLPERFNRMSATVTETQMIDELVTIGRAVYKMCDGLPPDFSFEPYMCGVNWNPATLDHTRTDRVLAAASRRLGWTMT